MLVGAIVPTTGELPSRLGLGRIAQTAEASGAQSLCVSDHLLMVDRDTTAYPYSADGRPTWNKQEDCYEAFTCCAFMAAVTRECRIGTAVLVLPQRNALEVAKIAASIDQLSGGRLYLGVGAGWYKDEIEALGYDYRARGARLDEMLQVLRECWTGRPAAFAGRHVTVPANVVLHPLPAQPAGPSLLVGGMTDAALRHAARYGDGWLSLGFVDSLQLDVMRERIAAVREMRRGFAGSELWTMLKLHATADQADELPGLAVELAGLGFDELTVEPPWELGLDAAGEAIASVRAALDGLD